MPSLPGKQVLKLAGGSALIAWICGVALMLFDPWHIVELKAFDLLTVASPPSQTLPITIVGIDEASFTQMGQRWPWPRDTHARLIERLVEGGAAVIAFDVLFPEQGAPQEDQAFGQAIRAAGNVVLAADNAFHETATVRQWLRVDPTPELTLAGAVTGLTTVAIDDDSVIRLMPDGDDAFWRQTIRTLVRAQPGVVQEPYVAPGAMMRYLGPARTFPYVSYYQVLNRDPAIPANFFANQIVLIGKDVRATLESGASQSDSFATPFLQRSRQFTPGVEVQATMIENALMGQTIEPAANRTNVLVLTASMLIALAWLVFWHPLRSALLMAMTAAALAALSGWQFTSHNVWFATATPVAALLIAFISMAAGSYWTEQRRATEVRSAFKLYVSEEVVNQMVAHPELLKLGGQRRELTVLFSDLAGFTSLSEQLAPEAVADLINLYLNEMTRVIMAHGGTVDKFVGDSVMAFWGAPLDDPAHAMHGVQAAIEMQKAMTRLQPGFRALGASEVSMRVGLHSGPAIVGNMGSDLRFEYTALGDTVNLASRLEGANKAYGTGILVSAATASLVAQRIELRPVDKVKVKGKGVAVEVFTPCDKPGLAAATRVAWAAYQRLDWAGAVLAWRAVLRLAPNDPLAQCHLARLARFETEPPEADWDGAVALDKL